MSLGALYSELSFEIHDVIADPVRHNIEAIVDVACSVELQLVDDALSRWLAV